ncbi:hypothetical protein J6X13_01335 [Candidatus Saccharibacteria bacterium]|nr:hypothetical protein [Candidatus Saccharibacteria bacterium]
MNEEQKIAEEEIQYRAQDIEKTDGMAYFEKPEDVKRKKKEEEKRVRAEAKRVLKESRESNKTVGHVEKNHSDYVPMSSEKASKIRRAILIGLIAIVSIGAATGLVVGGIYLYNTFWKTEKEDVLTDEERTSLLKELNRYYVGESDAKVDEDAQEIYEHLGEIYNKYNDKEIRVACLYRRVQLLYKIEVFTEKELKDAKEIEKLEKSMKSAYWLMVIYEYMGDTENAQKYGQKQAERIKDMGLDEENGEG